MEILHLKIVQQSRQVFITGSDAVKFTRCSLFNLIIVVIYVFKDIRFTNFSLSLFQRAHISLMVLLDPDPRMILVPQMIPKLDRKRSQDRK